MGLDGVASELEEAALPSPPMTAGTPTGEADAGDVGPLTELLRSTDICLRPYLGTPVLAAVGDLPSDSAATAAAGVVAVLLGRRTHGTRS